MLDAEDADDADNAGWAASVASNSQLAAADAYWARLSDNRSQTDAIEFELESEWLEDLLG
jgi:hypothetical protein